MRPILAAIAAVLVVSAAAIVFLQREVGVTDTPPAPAVAQPVAMPASVSPSPAPTGPPASASALAAGGPVLPPLPRSLQGTQPDGKLRVDSHGNLVVDVELRRFFDYYLAATGEEPDSLIRERILAQIRAQLPPKAAAQAEALLDKYLAYRDAGRSLEALPDDASLADRLAQVTALRRKYLGPEAEQGMFGDDEAVDRAALQRQQIESDATLTPAQREDREQAVESELPDRIRKERAETIAPLQLEKEEEEMRKEGASDEDIRHFREQTSGPESAQRLAQLDEERRQWQQRVDAFRAQLTQINSEPLSDQARQAEIDRVLQESFSATEQLRVRAITGLSAIP